MRLQIRGLPSDRKQQQALGPEVQRMAAPGGSSGDRRDRGLQGSPRGCDQSPGNHEGSPAGRPLGNGAEEAALEQVQQLQIRDEENQKVIAEVTEAKDRPLRELLIAEKYLYAKPRGTHGKAECFPMTSLVDNGRFGSRRRQVSDGEGVALSRPHWKSVETSTSSPGERPLRQRGAGRLSGLVPPSLEIPLPLGGFPRKKVRGGGTTAAPRFHFPHPGGEEETFSNLLKKSPPLFFTLLLVWF